MEILRVLIADDHPLFRHGIHEFLNLSPDIQVVGEATTGEEGITQAEALQPDGIFMDVNMPGVNGIEATRRILHDYLHIRILIVTMFEDDGTVFAAMRVGARIHSERRRKRKYSASHSGSWEWRSDFQSHNCNALD